MKKSIDEIMDMLDWNNDIEIQRQGIELGKKVKNYNVFILPRNGNDKRVWENCAEIICSKTVEEIEAYLYEILVWVKDLNWPGALKIMDKMKKIRLNQDISFRLGMLIDVVKKTEDNIWLENLLEIRNPKNEKIKSIDEIMDMLNENNDIEIQKQGIKLGKKVKNFSIFFQPCFGKFNEQIWQNCAEIICSKSTKELLPYLNKLFWWVKDLNVPGATKILNKIKTMNLEINVINELDKELNLISKIDNNNWLENLLEIKKSLEVPK